MFIQKPKIVYLLDNIKYIRYSYTRLYIKAITVTYVLITIIITYLKFNVLFMQDTITYFILFARERVNISN